MDFQLFLRKTRKLGFEKNCPRAASEAIFHFKNIFTKEMF
jgi:hypothetical protein